jgi:hypothetical protein
LLTSDQGNSAKAATTRTCSWRSRRTTVEPFTFVSVQHVRRAFPCGAGGQQHRFNAWARIVGHDSAAATEVVASMPATKRASSRRIVPIMLVTCAARKKARGMPLV